jgi:hypothetical protein
LVKLRLICISHAVEVGVLMRLSLTAVVTQ